MLFHITIVDQNVLATFTASKHFYKTNSNWTTASTLSTVCYFVAPIQVYGYGPSNVMYGMLECAFLADITSNIFYQPCIRFWDQFALAYRCVVIMCANLGLSRSYYL